MLTPRFIKILPALASFLVAAAMFIQLKAWAIADDATPFHQSVRNAIEAIPERTGLWYGDDINVPLPAAKLLRPNALFARRYQLRTGQAATLVIVHCTDSRDMSGHYPPNCYPANGWTPVGGRVESSLILNKRAIPVAIYRYHRTELGITVYNFFILPRELTTRMEAVRRSGGDRQSRPFGAAQVQVILNDDIKLDEADRIVEELLTPVAPVIELIQIRKEGTTP